MEFNLPNKDAVVLGNPESSVAVCTLWAQKEIIASRLDKNSFFICGNLYSMEGINHLIRTVFMNPHVRTIVVCGEDMSKSGETLLKLFENGIDENNGIKGTNFKIEKNIDADSINLFLKSVKIADMRRKSAEELKRTVQELNKKPEPFSEVKEFPKTRYGVDYVPSEMTGYNIRGNSIGDIWLALLDLVMKLGVEKKSESLIKQKELLNVVSVIENDGDIKEYFNFTKDDLEKYYPSMTTAEKPDKVSYTYGERLFRMVDGKDQMSIAVERLVKSPYSRRAVAFTWSLDDAKTDNPPCLTQVLWNIQFNQLCQTAIFRSHDIFGSWPMNVFALRKLQEDVAKKIGVGVGPLTCVSVSAHVYEKDWQNADELLKKYRVADHKFYQDPRGSFVIRIQDGQIIVDFYTQDGSRTQYSFRGTDPIKIYKEISQSNFISRFDHAANLGMELHKAALAIKLGKKYVQDEELELG